MWIAGAIKHPGALTAKAKAAGKTIEEYCSSDSLSPQSKKQCVLAKTLKSFSKK